MQRKLVIATRNRGKLREFQRLFADLSVRLTSLDELDVAFEVEETGATFEENAVLKARGYAESTGELTLADDSGLEVDALNGEPGVRSARYSGANQSDEDRNRFLLRKLEGVPAARRTARYRAVLALVDPQGLGDRILTASGTCEGRITKGPLGIGGFGYDPLVWIDRYGCTVAQLSSADKDRISHRGAAAREMRAILEHLLDRGG